MTEYTERPSTAPAFSEARLLEQLKGAGAVYLRGDFKEPDIDFFAPAQVLENLRTLLSENAFYLLRGDSSKQIWGRFVAGRLLQVDLTLNFDYIFKNFPGVSFRPEFVEAFLRSPLSAQLSFNVLRYLFMERAGSKYRQYILSNREQIIKEGFYLRELSCNPLREIKDLPRKLMAHIEKGRRISLWPFLRPGKLPDFLMRKVHHVFSQAGRGRSLALVGADGCGKSTVAGALGNAFGTRSIYMGSNDFVCQKLFLCLDRKGKFLSGIKFFLVYVENWFKFLRVVWQMLHGRVVIIDRHPAFQYFLQKGPGYFLNSLFYRWFFPRPFRSIILWAPAQIIRARKPELSEDTILALYQAYERELSGRRDVVRIENLNLDDTLNRILGIIGVR